MATDREYANRAMLSQAAETQQKTSEAVLRIKKLALETEALAEVTSTTLRDQGDQMDGINAELDHISVELDKTQVLQNKFDRWAGNFWGGKKNAAIRNASRELIKNNEKGDDPTSKIREVYEVEKFDSISRIWRPVNVFLCSNPAIAAKEVFNPKSMKEDGVAWGIDYSHSNIDAEGWTYGYDNAALIKNGGGDSSRKWNCYARRRKWFLEEKKAASNLASISAVRDRQHVRIGVISSAAGATGREKEKIGYVPRGQSGLTASGLTSAGMMGGRGSGGDQTLDEESAARLAQLKADDEEIDKGLDSISNIVSHLGDIAGDINSEINLQNKKVENIEMRMERGREKQSIVNARLLSHVKNG